MFTVIHLPQFALQAALRHEPEVWARPIALVDPALSTPRVCDVTPAAATGGVTVGLTPTQALARCRDVVIRHRSPVQEAAATDALLQCAYGFSPNIENTAPGTVTLDLRGLSELNAAPVSGAPSPTVGAWGERFRAALAALNLRARLGLGPTPNVARHAAHWRPSSPVGGSEAISIIADAPAFVASLPVAALEPSTDVAPILEKWGIRTVGALLALGQEALVERLGLEALALFAAASTTALRPLRLVRPVEHYEESFEFEHTVETVEPLLFILRRFVDYLSQRLELSGLVAALLTLRLRLDSGESIERRLRLPQPTRQADMLFRMLHTHLESLRTDSPIAAVALQAAPTAPEQKQFNLFEAALRDPHQFQETLARLSALLGAERVGTPVREDSHRPDAFKLVPPDFENAPDLPAERVVERLRAAPLRRLRPAVKAQTETADDDAQPVSIRCAVANGKLKVALGPWRASGHWWEPGAWRREDWDVQTREGPALRLVQRAEGWFVEGVGD